MTDSSRRAPATIRYAVAGTLVAALLQIVVGILLWANRVPFFEAQQRLHPELPLQAVTGRAEGIVYGGLGTHLVLFVIYLVLARGVARGGRMARIRLSGLLVLSSVAGTIAAMVLGAQVPGIRIGIASVQIASTALRVAVLYLLWLPAASKSFFVTSPDALR